MNRLTFTAMHAEDVTGRTIEIGWPSEESVQQSVFSILQNNVLCSIASVTHEGRPHINTAYFSCSDNLELYFLSHPGSLHCRNLASGSWVAMTVFSSAQQWTEPGHGVQLFGTCEQTMGSSAEEAERSYASRFPGYASWKATLASDDLARQYRFYRFEVSELKILDEKNLGDAVFVRASVVRRTRYSA
jgi:uncharacterized protein YhbP (UPF0306 family)